jgi:hypothetical protein
MMRRILAEKRPRVMLMAFLVAGGALALSWENHGDHIMGALPYLLFLLCPLIHLFLHRGHGGHGKH